MGVYSVAFAIKDAGGLSREYVLPFNNLTATAAPGVNDDSGDGYIPGSMWVDVTNDETYFCEDNSLGAAVWKQAGGGGSVAWGAITGTLSDQTDLQTALNAKQDEDALLDDIAALSDPGADRILFWDDSAGEITWLTAGTGLTITGTTMTASGSGITGSGTTNTIPRWTSSSALGDSTITDDGTNAILTKNFAYGTAAALVTSTGSNQDNLSLSAGTLVIFGGLTNAIDFTGMVDPGYEGREVTILNESNYSVTIKHNATSTAENRFFCPGNSDYVLETNGTVQAVYRADRWHVIGAKNYSGSTGSGNVVLATSPTITTPTIGDFSNSQHNHQSAGAGGSLNAAAIGSGTLDAARIPNLDAGKITTGNVAVARGGTGVGALQSFSAYRNTNQSLPTAAWTKIAIDTERFDIGGIFDTSTNKSTPNVASLRMLFGMFYSSDCVSNTLYAIAIYKNGALYALGNIEQITATITNKGFLATGLATANGSTDYFELYGYNGHATNTLTVVGGANNNHFDGCWAGPSA